MTNKQYAVIFTENNARIIRDADLIEEMKDWDNVLVNPNLSSVYGIPPHLWKIREEDDHIIPLEPHERVHRLNHIKHHGVLNEGRDPAKWQWNGEPGLPPKEHWMLKAPIEEPIPAPPPPAPPSNVKKYLLYLGLGSCILTVLTLLLKGHI